MSIRKQPRTSGAELPTADELLAILEEESSRMAVKFDFLSTYDSIFTAHRELSRFANSNDSWIEKYPSLSLDQLIQAINGNHAELTRYIQQGKYSVNLLKDFYQSLVPKEDLSTSDALFVFGAASNARIERAVELYRAGIAPKIIISGHRPIYGISSESEASRMAKIAVDSGISSDNLILEEGSITIADNVKKTLDLLEMMDWRPISVTIVATNFVLQRSLMDWYKFTPWDIEIKPVAAHPQSARFTENGWYDNEETVALILNEYAKLVLESKIDLMRRNGEIPN